MQREVIAGRDQPLVAATLGVPVLRHRIMMFVLGSAIAAAAGAIFVHARASPTPDSFGITLGLGIFVMLILGGLDSRWGPVVGAAFYVFVPQWLQGGVLGISGPTLTVHVFGQDHRAGDFRDIFFGVAPRGHDDRVPGRARRGRAPGAVGHARAASQPGTADVVQRHARPHAAPQHDDEAAARATADALPPLLPDDAARRRARCAESAPNPDGEAPRCSRPTTSGCSSAGCRRSTG